MRTLAIAVLGVVFFPITMLVAVSEPGRDGPWQWGNVAVYGAFHALMWLGIARLCGWL